MRAPLFNDDGWMWRGRVSCISGRALATHRQKMKTHTFNDDAGGVGGEVVLLFIHQQRAGTRCGT